MATIKPIFLLADSQLLFWREDDGKPFLERARDLIAEDEPGKAIQAAYLGAANGDVREFYDLFVGAMAEIGIRDRDCRMIPASPSAEDLAFLETADLILLAGGDVRRGWEAFRAAGLNDKLVERYYAGALLLGVSAGAVQLGLKGWDEDGGDLFDTLRLVPFVIDAHDEPSWAGLNRAVGLAGEHARGIGLPSGGGALYHPDHSLEPIRRPLTEIDVREGGEGGEGEQKPHQALLFPGEQQEAPPAEPAGPSPIVQELLRDGTIVLQPDYQVHPATDAAPDPDEDTVN